MSEVPASDGAAQTPTSSQAPAEAALRTMEGEATPASTGSSGMTLSLRGLSVYAHHGVSDDERALGQRFEFDVDLEMPHCAACRTDSIDDAVDYQAVVEVVVEVATQFRFHLLEALADALCLELLAEFPAERVRLSVHKPAPPIAQVVARASVSVERDRAHLVLAEA